MVASIIYSFVHGCKTYTLYSFNCSKDYNALLSCYDSEKDLIQYTQISRELFIHQSLKYVDDNVEYWFDNSEKIPNL